MRIIEYTFQHSRVQVTHEQMSKIVASREEFLRHPVLLNTPVLLQTHAKAYYRGGGWWDIMGYAYDGTDVRQAVALLQS